MEEIIITISKETRMVDLPKTFIGNDGENLQTKLVFKFNDEFVNGQARIEYSYNNSDAYLELEKVDKTYVLPIKNIMSKVGVITMQLCITQGTSEVDVPVFKSKTFRLRIGESINADIEAPEGYDSWIETANAKLNSIEATQQQLINLITEVQRKLDYGEFKGNTGDSVTNANINSNGELLITVGGVN